MSAIDYMILCELGKLRSKVKNNLSQETYMEKLASRM
jgi:hypothetical protein